MALDSGDDIVYTTDVTASPIVFSQLVALDSGDHISAIQELPIGPGVTVIVGEISDDQNVWFKEGSTAAVWTMSATVVSGSEEDSDDNTPVESTGAIAPFSVLQVDVDNADWGGVDYWATMTEIIDDDNSYATAGVVPSTHVLVGLWDFRDYVPQNADIIGVEFKYKRLESNADDNIYTAFLSLLTSINATLPPSTVPTSTAPITVGTFSILGMNKADSATEWATTEEQITAGSSTDLWGFGLTAPIVRSPGFGVGLGARTDTGATPTASTEGWTLNITFRRKGSTASGGFESGQDSGAGSFDDAWQIQPSAAHPERVGLVVDGKPAFLEFQWEPALSAPSYTVTRPNPGMEYVWAACPYGAGYAFTGTNGPFEPGVFLNILGDGEASPTRYEFPASYGGYDTKINSIGEHGLWLRLEVVFYTAGSSTVVDEQIWYFHPDKGFQADTLLQSKSNALSIAAAPLTWTSYITYPALDYEYSVFPNSTDTAVRRNRVQPDLSADYRVVNADWTKSMAYAAGTENTALKFRTPRMSFGPQEANKVLNVIRHGDRLISTSTGTYGSVTVDVVTDGDTTFASPEVTKEFTSALQVYNVISGGVAYDDMMLRFSLTHEAGSVKTPGTVLFTLETHQAWVKQYYLQFFIEEGSFQPNDVFLVLARLDALEATKLTNTLTYANLKDDNTSASSTIGALAICEGFPNPEPVLKVSPRGEVLTLVAQEGSRSGKTILFRLVPGTIEAA
jgi:hypothetical protein